MSFEDQAKIATGRYGPEAGIGLRCNIKSLNAKLWGRATAQSHTAPCYMAD